MPATYHLRPTTYRLPAKRITAELQCSIRELTFQTYQIRRHPPQESPQNRELSAQRIAFCDACERPACFRFHLVRRFVDADSCHGNRWVFN